MEMKTILYVFCIFCYVIMTSVSSQRNVAKPKVKPKPVTDGRWRPTRRRPAPPPAGRPVTNQRPAANNGRTPQRNPPMDKFRQAIRPPLRRHEGEPPLQKPSWIHCLNSIEVSDNWAIFTSPGYPDQVSGQLQCTWRFYGTEGSRIRLSFDDFDLEAGEGGKCAAQFVDVIDMALGKSQGRFCGKKIPGDYVTVGSLLRVDIQADVTVVPHKGFMAAVRLEPESVQPGMRGRSLRADGPITTPPPPPPRTRKIIRRPQPTATRAPPVATQRVVPSNRVKVQRGQNIYGQDFQPPVPTDPPSSGDLPMYLYILIGIVCVLILIIGTAFVFRNSILKRLGKYRNKKKEFLEDQKKPDNNSNSGRGGGRHDNAYGSYQRFQLPQEVVHYHPEQMRRRRSVVFEDEVLASMENDQNPYNAGLASVSGDLRRSQSLTNINTRGLNFQGWNYPYSEPVYDEDDRMSVWSVDSHRSSMRHPDHERFKREKIMERENALGRNAADVDDVSPYESHYVSGPQIQQQHMQQHMQQMQQQQQQLMQPQMQNQQQIQPQRNYDDIVDIQRQQAAAMMQQLRGARSMNDLSKLGGDDPQMQRTVSMAEIPVEGALLRRQMQRRQSFRL